MSEGDGGERDRAPCKLAAASPEEAQQAQQVRHGEELRDADGDGDGDADGGVVDESVLRAEIERQRVQHQVWGRLEEAFVDIKQLEGGDSPGITVEAFQRALEQHGLGERDVNKVRRYFDALDYDADKVISWKEFYIALAGQAGSVADLQEPLSDKDNNKPTRRVLRHWIALANKPVLRFPARSKEKWKYLLAGAFAGGISRTATAPVERVKVLLQVQGMRSAATVSAAAVSSSAKVISHSARPPGAPGAGEYKGLVGSLRKILAEEGWRGMFRGNGVNVLRVAPSNAVRFLTFEMFSQRLLESGRAKLTTMENLVAGSGAGLVSTVVTYPLDLIRSRLSVQTATNARYKGFAHAFSTVFREEGLVGFFRGVTTSVYGAVPYVALNFTFYEMMKNQLTKGKKQGERPGTLVSLFCGGVSGSVSMTMTYPFELIRRRMMVQGMGGAPRLYTSTFDAFTKIYTTEGVRGMFSGVGANYWKVIPSMAITFGAYEMGKRLFNLQ